VLSLSGHTNVIEEIAFSRDGKYVATAGVDGTARIWDALTGQELFHFIHPRGVEAVAFSPDGRRLVTGSDDGRLRVFLLDREELVRVAQARVTRWWTRDECREYLHGPCPDKTSTLARKFNSEFQPGEM
jgi:WD40 repeat protein